MGVAASVYPRQRGVLHLGHLTRFRDLWRAKGGGAEDLLELEQDVLNRPAWWAGRVGSSDSVHFDFQGEGSEGGQKQWPLLGDLEVWQALRTVIISSQQFLGAEEGGDSGTIAAPLSVRVPPLIAPESHLGDGGEDDISTARQREASAGSSSASMVRSSTDCYIDRSELKLVADSLRQGVPLKNRRHGLLKFRNCFVGQEAVSWLVDNKYAPDRGEAIVLGNLMLKDGFFHHVLLRHTFRDAQLFYRFSVDEYDPQVWENAFQEATRSKEGNAPASVGPAASADHQKKGPTLQNSTEVSGKETSGRMLNAILTDSITEALPPAARVGNGEEKKSDGVHSLALVFSCPTCGQTPSEVVPVPKRKSGMAIDLFNLRTLRHIKKGQWRLGPRIGSGSFGTVHKGMNEETGQLIAVKALPLEGKSGSKSVPQMASVEQEVSLLRKMNHPHVVQYLGVDYGVASNTLFIFSEWVPGGSLRDVLDEFGALKDKVARDYSRQVLLGLRYLHDNHIIHRDIKAGNVLIHENGHIKLTDFGASKILREEDNAEHTMKGTPYFMAPEVVATGSYGRKADIWSFGGFVIELLTGQPPWAVMGIRSTLDVYRLLLQTEEIPPLPAGCSDLARSFMLRALLRDQDRRPTARDLLGDAYVNLNPLDLLDMMQHVPTNGEARGAFADSEMLGGRESLSLKGVREIQKSRSLSPGKSAPEPPVDALFNVEQDEMLVSLPPDATCQA